MKLDTIRRHYESHSISQADLDADPLVEFGKWLQQAIDLKLLDATAMTLATATDTGIPSARVVLLKGYDGDGFCWYSDTRSQKGRELAANPWAALLFYWRDLNRQIRVQGRVDHLSAEQARRYFDSRPIGSRFSAASSCQSAPVASRAVLETRVRQLRERYTDGNVPKPKAWTGYHLKPVYFEFWQGQVNRLHDRIVYQADGDAWLKSRLSP